MSYRQPGHPHKVEPNLVLGQTKTPSGLTQARGKRLAAPVAREAEVSEMCCYPDRVNGYLIEVSNPCTLSQENACLNYLTGLVARDPPELHQEQLQDRACPPQKSLDDPAVPVRVVDKAQQLYGEIPKQPKPMTNK